MIPSVQSSNLRFEKKFAASLVATMLNTCHIKRLGASHVTRTFIIHPRQITANSCGAESRQKPYHASIQRGMPPSPRFQPTFGLRRYTSHRSKPLIICWQVSQLLRTNFGTRKETCVLRHGLLRSWSPLHPSTILLREMSTVAFNVEPGRCFRLLCLYPHFWSLDCRPTMLHLRHPVAFLAMAQQRR